VILNKLDLCKEGEADTFLEPYIEMGYPAFATSALTGDPPLDRIHELLAGRTSMLLGHSGVGKSSLLNTLDPGLQLRVGELTRRHAKGSHTTTFSSLLRLCIGGAVVDCPGIREFGIKGIAAEDLGNCFLDFRPFHKQCRYPNCTHDHEPECAVKQALDEGQIRKARYESYKKLLQELYGDGERMPRHGSFS
jgi:ribosome biogenesis GTPase